MPIQFSSGARPHAHLGTILDAAEAVVLRDGMGRLTLDAVAKQAGLSKAGLLHHLPSKDALIGAMVERNVTEWHDEFRSIYTKLAAAGESRPATGTMMSTCLSGKQAWTEVERARNRVLIAALVHDEKQIEPMRRVMRDIEGLIAKDKLPPGVGDAIHLAVHGLWFQWIFGMGDVSHTRLTQIRSALATLGGFDRMPVIEIDLANGSGTGKAGTGKAGTGKAGSGIVESASASPRHSRQQGKENGQGTIKQGTLRQGTLRQGTLRQGTIKQGAEAISSPKRSSTKSSMSRSKSVQSKGAALSRAASRKRGVS